MPRSNRFLLRSYNVYASYTYLDDDADGTKCLADKTGALYTQWCADAGVYYLNSLNFPAEAPSLVAPNGFKSMTTYGLFPWWPTSGSAKAYRALNADSTVPPVYDGDGADPAYTNYITTFASNNTANLLELMGQAPGSKSSQSHYHLGFYPLPQSQDTARKGSSRDSHLEQVLSSLLTHSEPAMLTAN